MFCYMAFFLRQDKGDILMEKWVEIRKGGNFVELGKKYNISPILARLLINRGLSEDEFEIYLKADINNLYDSSLLKDAPLAAELLIKKIKDNKRIRIIGDYDIDGVFSAYIFEKTLLEVAKYFNPNSDERLVDVVLPDRIIDGYGMNKRLIREAFEAGVDTILTCDNGISAAEEIEYAKGLGLTVVVTDHHEVPYHEENEKKVYEIPKADAIVNPKQEDCRYPCKLLCGGGVAYKLSQLIFKMAGIEKPKEYLLEMAAFATIGDVMELKDENRIIVKNGLKLLTNTNNIGLKELINQCELGSVINAWHVGFVLGPCINAAGRLENAHEALKLLQCENHEAAVKQAEKLREINNLRKELTDEGVKRAIEIIEAKESLPKVLVIYLPGCHESIAGIIAGRLREQYMRPSFVLTDTKDGLKGSGRSIETYDMHKALIACRDNFTKFGGHKSAAGFSMSGDTEEKRIKAVEDLSKMLNDAAQLTEEDFVEKVEIDMILPFSYITEDVINQLDLLEPIGTGNKEPLFGAKNVRILDSRVQGKNRNCLKLNVQDENGKSLETVFFGEADKMLCELPQKEEVIMTFSPQINEFRGMRSIQLKGKGIR